MPFNEMHSSAVRLNSVFSTFLTVTMVLTALVSLSTFFFDLPVEGATVDVNRLRINPGHGYRPDELKAYYDVDVDLENLFDWNTKQVFLYLTAEHNNGTRLPRNTQIVWDTIVRDRKDSKVSLKNIKQKYPLKEVEKDSFTNSYIQVKLRYDRTPHVGFLTSGTVAETGLISLPSQKVKRESVK